MVVDNIMRRSENDIKIFETLPNLIKKNIDRKEVPPILSTSTTNSNQLYKKVKVFEGSRALAGLHKFYFMHN